MGPVPPFSWEFGRAESRHAGVFASQDDCLDIFAKFDDDESGEITYDEFAEVSFSSSSNLAKISSGEQSLLGSLECFSLPDVLLCVPC